MTTQAAPPRARTLTEALRRADADALTTLLTLRPDLTYPLPRDVAELANRATTGTSIGRALDRLDAWTRLVAEALAACADECDVTEVSALTGRPDAVPAALDRLRRQALLWGPDEQLHLVRGVREAFEPYPGGLAPPSPRPLEPEHLDAALAELEPAGRALLDRLVWAPSGAVRRADRPVSTATARSPVEQLLARGLLRPLDAETVLLPREVAWRLREGRFRAEPVEPTPPAVTGLVRSTRLVDHAAAGAAFELVHQVERAVHQLETVPHRLLRTGGVAARDVAALARRLGVESTQATFVLECAAAAGLAAPGGNLCLLPTTDLDRWLALPGGERWRRLARGWLAAPRWFCAAAEPGTHALGPEADAATAPATRALLVALVAALPAGTTPDLDRLTAALAWHRPRAARGPVEAATLVDWTWREAGWLGLTGLGATSAFAAALPDAAAAGSLPAALAELFPLPVRQLVLQADLTAVAPGPLAHDVAAELALLAEEESRGGGGVHRFSADSLRRAFDVGWSAADVHGWLAGHATTPVPQPLAYLVDDVARRHGSIRVGVAGSFLRLDDPAEAAALLARPEAPALGLRQVAPSVLVCAGDADELVAFLRGAGQTPVVEDAGGRTLTPPPGQRAPARPGPGEPPRGAEPAEVVTALLAAERNRPEPREGDEDATAATLDRLREATRAASPVWVDYVAADGRRTARELAPLDLTPGAVRAVDRASAQVVTIPLARIWSVRPPSDPVA